MAKYYNQKHVPKQFKRGQLVKLSTRNLKLKYPKLAPRWIGPFRTMKRIRGQAYHLALPEKYSKLHDVFPMQFLEDYKQREGLETILPMPDLQDDQEEWEVQEVKGSKNIDGIQHYLVKWTGWPSEYDTWEPIEHLTNAKQKIKEWEKSNGKRQRISDEEDSDPGETLPRKRRKSNKR